MNTLNNIWIGLIEVKPLENNDYIKQNQGAFTNLLLYAKNKEDYIEKAKEFMCSLDFDIYKFEDVENVLLRLKNYNVDDELKELINKVQLTNQPYISTLHVFDRVKE